MAGLVAFYGKIFTFNLIKKIFFFQTNWFFEKSEKIYSDNPQVLRKF